MTITSKLVDVGGIFVAVADETDTIDVNGFSESIQVVGAKTAQFSNLDIMRANTGKRIGIRTLKINSFDAIPAARVEVVGDFIDFSPVDGTTVDNNETTSSNSTDQGATGVAVIDYGTVDTRDIKLVTRMTAIGAEFGTGNITFFYEISSDGTNFTVPVTSPSQFQILNIPTGNVPRDTGIITYNDPNPQTVRFVRLTVASSGGTPAARIWYIYQVTIQEIGVNQVTVRVRSSVTLDGTDGTPILPDQVMNTNESLTFNTDLLLTGDEQFVTLEIISFTNFDVEVSLSEITSIKEV